MAEYFWDSYAIIELIIGNPRYAKYIKQPVVLTLFNLAEIYWFAIREYTETEANEIYGEYCQGVAKIDDLVLKEAIKFRSQHKNKNLSYADCIGYVFALKNNLKFLTGDKEFKNMQSVEFVR